MTPPREPRGGRGAAGPPEGPRGRLRALAAGVRIGARFIIPAAAVIAVVGLVMIALLSVYLRRHALAEAAAKADILISRNLATHAYFSRELKPRVFAAVAGKGGADYFEPAWMSSTYAVRHIGEYSASLAETAGYYYKECAVNARSPENEADDYERGFLEELNRDPGLERRSGIRVLEGRPYFVLLRRGETLDQDCLLCHDTPDQAPQGLVEIYGPERSFGRHAGEVVSAMSVRIPLATAYARANRLLAHLSGLLALLLVVLAGTLYLVNRKVVVEPVRRLRGEARAIAAGERELGAPIPVPGGPELADLTRAFNAMSSRLREGRDGLEERVRERTADLAAANADLTRALSEVKTLSGLLPICAACKKIRDDKGYWNQLEHYLADHTDAQLTHGMCPDCLREHYPEIVERLESKARGSGPESGGDS